MPIPGLNSPFSASGLWDSITIQGTLWVGKVEVRNARRAYKYQGKDAPGLEGETNTYRGRRGEHFDIIFYVWNDALFRQWTVFSQLFFNQTGAKGMTALSIDYPSLAGLGITQILVVDVGGLEPVGEDHMFAAKVKVKEYLPVVPINVTHTPIAGPPPIFLPPSPTAAQAAADNLKAQAAMANVLGLKTGLPF